MIAAVRDGKRDALERLLERIYPEFRAVAASLLRNERCNHTLQPTALAHEALIRLFLEHDVPVKDRAHLMALAGRQMRHILIEHARARLAQRRGGGAVHASVGPQADEDSRDLESFVVLDDLLAQLRGVDERSCRVVELRFFGGLSREEIAEHLNVTIRTVQRDWDYARAWLLDALRHPEV